METAIQKEGFLAGFDRKLNVIFSIILIVAIAVMFLITQNALSVIVDKYFGKLENLELVILFTGVLFVTGIYRQIDSAVDNFLYWTKFLKNGRLSLICTSLFLGLMPVKGRTILSSPVVAQIAKKNDLDNFSASMVDYLSTHIYYLIFPLSASLMFVVTSMKFDYLNFVLLMMPGALFLALAVWYYSSKSKVPASFAIESKSSFIEATKFILPIVLLLVFLGASEMYKVPYSILVGTVLFIALSLVFLRPNLEQLKKAYKSIDLYLVFILALILLLSAFTSNSTMIKGYFTGMINSTYSIPILIIVGYLVGFTIGSSSTMVSVIFPILAPLLSGNPSAYPIAAIVYASEYAGYIASPAHPCCHYAASFFKIPYMKVWLRITLFSAIAAGLIIAAALLVMQ
jgi:hypothetical protein